MRIAVVFFGPISREKKLLNFSSYNNEIVLELNKRGLLGRLFCKDFSLMPEIDADSVEIFSGSIYSKFASVLYQTIGRLFGISERYFFEAAFDIFVRYRINFDEFDTLFLLRETNLKLCKDAKKKQKKVIGILSIYPLAFEREQIKKQELKLSIREKSNYTSKRRIYWYNNILDSWDWVISLSGSKATRNILSGFDFSHKLIFPSAEFGVDRTLFSPKAKPKNGKVIFLITTDDTLKKGIHVVLRAWENLNDDCIDRAELLVVGTIGKNLSPLIARFSNRNVTFLGYSLILEDLYAKSHVFICPSIIDMGPRTIKQAMTCGVPVVASIQCGASSFIVDKEDGFIFHIDDENKLGEILTYCIDHPEEVALMGKRSAVKARMFDNDLFASDIVNLITTLPSKNH